LKNTAQFLASWGNYPRVNAEVFEPANRAEIQSLILENERIIARGNGKSYGDAALAPKLISTHKLDQIISFDAEQGVVECEAGVMLSDLLKIMVPAGWFFQVTPGIKQITVGGAIASDVHGKNHPGAGCFSEHLISFELMTASGEVKTCSRSENAELFWQTCGGMGWTGVVLSAKFKLLKIHSSQMLQKTVRAANLEAVFSAFETHQIWPYAAGWVDCTHADWRGAVFFADHVKEDSSPLSFEEAPKRNVPFYAPSWLLNPLSIKAHNYFYNRKNKDGERQVTLDKYFYPLDALQNWNRFYGKRGLVQYQFCVPENNAKIGIHQVLQTIRKSGETPFLTVLKRHGERAPEAIHSFPIRGYSLALDFPRTRGIFDLVKSLDPLVWDLGGKIYLTKDACSAPQMGRVNPASFGEHKFSSLLKERIGQ
jgi:decaprenylphospho-beta-D-ribofuranose 2-oxidase